MNIVVNKDELSQLSMDLACEIVDHSYDEVSEIESLSEIIENWLTKNIKNYQ